MKRQDASRLSEEFPFDFSWHEAIYALYAIQHYESMGDKRFSYQSGIFYNQIFHVLVGLKNSSSRKTMLNHLDNPQCMVCQGPMSLKGKVLDHIIPRSKGGPDNLENTLLLCLRHNSSKGKKDLIEWWIDKKWPAESLPRQVICLYARMMWQYLDRLFDDPYDLPDYIRVFITDRVSTFPSEDHKVALYGSTYAAMGFLGWERRHEPGSLL